MCSAIVTSHLSASLEHAEARAHHDDSNIDVLKDNHENGSHGMLGLNINATWDPSTTDLRHCRIAARKVPQAVVLQFKVPEHHHDSMPSAIVTSHLPASLEHAEARAHLN